jgi:hypothetical protein
LILKTGGLLRLADSDSVSVKSETAMSIEQAEQLKRDLTDKWVVVDKTTPELRRFSGLTGKVKTVNMSCRALVEFNGPADIGWYDIDPSFLTVVDEPVKKEKAAAPAKAEKKPAGGGKAAGGGSPLDAIRKAGAGAPAAKKPAGGSPLDAIRKAGAGGAKKPAAGGGSPLDMIRKQGAGGAAPAKEAEPEPAAEEPVAEVAPAEEAAPAEAAAGPAEDLSGLSPIEQIRKSGAFKG